MGLLRPHHPAHGAGVRLIARSPVQWVPGGHSWMLARPQGQTDILTHLAPGREFVARSENRWRQFTPREYTLRAVN